ncbi:MAG TPA: LysE family transporter [Ignavibacteria bacterium]
MLITLIGGIITGFVVSIPPLGPIAFALLSKGFNGDFKEGMAIAFGSAFMDFVYALIAFGGISLIFVIIPDSIENFYLNHMNGVQIALIYAGCAVVIVYGIKLIKSKVDYYEIKTKEAEAIHKAEARAGEFVQKAGAKAEHFVPQNVPMKKASNYFGLFVMGIMLCLSSITLPASWIAVVGYVKSFRIIESSFLGGLVFSAGAFAGTALWFFSLLKLITGNKHRINRSTLGKLNTVAGIILIILGVILFGKATEAIFNIF